MVLSKSNSRIFLIVIAILGLIRVQSWSQADSSAWTDEQWQKAKEGIEYINPEEETEEEEETSEPFAFESSDEGHWYDFFTGELGKSIAFIVLISLLVFILYKLLTQGSLNKDKKPGHTAGYSLEHIEDHFEESDMDRFLRLALEASDYKAAVRILYLRTLQTLHKLEWIEWKKDKTNRAFLSEMRPRSCYKTFREITLVFEVVWYGETDLQQAEFERVKKLFDTFNQQLNGSKEK